MTIQNASIALKKLFEAPEQFKGASSDELEHRKSARRKEWENSVVGKQIAKIDKWRLEHPNKPWIGKVPEVCTVCGSDDIQPGDGFKYGNQYEHGYVCLNCDSISKDIYSLNYIGSELEALGELDE